ncbi:uncharacterized protein LOC111104257 [Crassostrea virginica]
MNTIFFLSLYCSLVLWCHGKGFVENCRDLVSSCAEMPELCFSNEYLDWAKTNCPKYCGFCDEPFSEKIKNENAGDCADTISNCFWYEDSVCFGTNEEWARSSCPQRCGYCGNFESLCVDQISYCDKLSPSICTEKSYRSWSRMNCRKFCNLCAEPTKSTTTTTTTTTPKPFILDPLTENEPRNGQWSYWDSWSDCTVSCGGGLRSRNRSCTNPPPKNGGDSCIGISLQSEACNSFMCPDIRR